MVTVIPSERRHRKDLGWLDARWHFSFADYHDPTNVHFGPLRVFNDDLIRAGGGFDAHPHRDMEIVSYVVAGGLRHRDSNGNDHVTTRGGVQVMSAGKGIVHSEEHGSPDGETVRLLQIWILPRTKGGPPRWAQKSFEPAFASAGGQWVTLVSGDGAMPGSLPIDQDASIHVARPRAGQRLSCRLAGAGRRAYLFVVSGRVTLAPDTALSTGDQARLQGVDEVTLTTDADAEVMLIDLP